MSWLIGAIYLLNFISIITILFIERKKPSSAFGWILILTFLPIVGFILYPLIGKTLRPNQKKIFNLKKEFDNLYNERLQKKHLLSQNNLDNILDENMNQYEDLIRMNYNAVNSIYSQDNDITIFTQGKDKFDSLISDIENAKDTIHIVYYIINNDNLSKKIINLLTKKAKEGVEVRFLYDHVGSIFTPHKIFKELIKAGGHVHRFFPLTVRTYMRVNYRNHRKIAIIDGKIGYTGGMNIGDEYLGLHKRLNPWRDTHIRLTGSSVYTLQERFLMDWSYASNHKTDTDKETLQKFFPPIKPEGDTGVQILSSGPDVRGEQIKTAYIKMITSAKKSIYIQTPYFIPDDSLLDALEIAALSGVDVKIMLPAIPDKRFVYRATTSYIDDVLRHGIKVYLYNGFLHAKMLTIDGKVTSIGTANMDIRSFAHNFEINTLIFDSNLSKWCSKAFEEDMQKSKLVTRETYDSRGLGVKMLESISRLMSPLL
ncbi:cardiolipin synthase [Proteinivorax hydrogeniformans]|uniref:Cardiolipin synthase n=1 Tax=Proteinivorax hydrogeniformans TaxID=1826727 RepID=A0AAU8HS73_9FIRM